MWTTLRRSRVRWSSVGLLLSAAAALAYEYYLNIDVAGLAYNRMLQDLILSDAAESPYRYRVLVPLFTNAVSALFAPFMSADNAYLGAYAVYDLIECSLLLLGLYALLRQFYREEWALIGALFVATVMPVAFHDHFYQPWSILEVAFFTLGLLAIYLDRQRWLAALVVLACFNRETGVFLPLVYLCATLPWPLSREALARWTRSRPFWQGVLYLAIWAAIFAGLRGLLGPARQPGLLERFPVNLDPGVLKHSAVNLALFFGVGWVLAVQGYRQAHPFLKRIAWVSVPYGVLMVFFGTWYEVRLIMLLYPLLAGLLLARIAPESARVQREQVDDSVAARNGQAGVAAEVGREEALAGGWR